MAFDPKYLLTTGGQAKTHVGQTLFYISTVDDKSTVSADGYFNSYREYLFRGDYVAVLDVSGSNAAFYSLRVTTKPIGGNVTTEVIDITTDRLNVDYIDFNLNPTTTPQEGRLYWNPDDGTLNLGLTGVDVNLQIGQESLIRAINNEGVQINNGQVVYIDGANSDRPIVKLANASEENGAFVVAVATEDVLNGEEGYFTVFGLVRDIDTSSFSIGDRLFLNNTDGGITKNELDHPSYRVQVGYCLKSHATEGVILVTIKSELWLKTFQSMQEPTGFDADQPNLKGDISFTDGTRTFEIAVKDGQDYFNFWIGGKEYRKTTPETIVITDVEGLHYIYFDSNGNIQEAVNPSDATIDSIIRELPLVSVIYWDATNKNNVWFNEERHENQMDGSVRSCLHFTRGTQWLSGGALGDFSIDGTGNGDEDAQFSISLGNILDEDLLGFWATVLKITGAPILYKDGSGGNWRKAVNTGFSVITTGTGRLAWNEFTGSSWQLKEANNGRYILAHIVATLGVSKQIYSIVGEAEYLNIIEARQGANNEANDLVTSGLPGPEFIFLGTVIFQTSDSYGNAVKARTRTTDLGTNYVDWRTTELSPVTPATNHSALTGLANDDHLQYLRTDGTRVLAGAWDLDNYALTNVNIDSGAIDGVTIGATSPSTIKGTTIEATTSLILDSQTIIHDSQTFKFSDTISSVAGTVTRPAYTLFYNLNTGMWFSATDHLNFSTGGVERFELNNTLATFTIPVTVSGNINISTGSIYKINNSSVLSVNKLTLTSSGLVQIEITGGGAGSKRCELLMNTLASRGAGVKMVQGTPEWWMGTNYNAGSAGYFQIGYDASGGQSEYIANRMLSIDTNGRVVIPGTSVEMTVQIVTGADVSATSNGFLVLGAIDSANLAIDNNEIMARNNGSASTSLYLQYDAGALLSRSVYNNTISASANVYVASNGLLQRATCGEIYKNIISDVDTNVTEGIFNVDIKKFTDKNDTSNIEQYSIIANQQTYNALPNAVVSGWAIVHISTNKVFRPIDDPSNFELKNENGNNELWGYIKNRKDKMHKLENMPAPVDEYEFREIYDSLNWNFITTALILECKKLKDKVASLETRIETLEAA